MFCISAKHNSNMYTTLLTLACVVFSKVHSADESFVRINVERFDALDRKFAEMELKIQRQEETLRYMESNQSIMEKRIMQLERSEQLVEDLEAKVEHLLQSNIQHKNTIERLQKDAIGTINANNNSTRKCDHCFPKKRREIENGDQRSERRMLKRRNSTRFLSRGIQETEHVAFSTYLKSAIDNLGIGQPVKYDQVLLNDGNHYNKFTGVFTVPVDGVYVFSYRIAEYRVHQIWVGLVVDGVEQNHGIADAFHNYQDVQGGNFAVVRLTAGQSVWIENKSPDAYIWAKSNERMDSFSGFLLY